jgi:hypothetical protein
MKIDKNKENWIKTLHKLRLHHLTATILEALGPINLLGAQLVYISQPVLSPLISQEQSDDIARILEDPSETADFITALRSFEPTC